MDRDVPHGSADPRAQGTLELFIASGALLFAVSGLGEIARNALWNYFCHVGFDTFAGQQIRHQLVNLQWVVQRPVARAHLIARRRDLQQLDRQLYAWRFWHTLATALTTNPMSLYQCSAFGFRVVCAQCADFTSICCRCPDNILCLCCTPVDLICRTCVVRRRMQQEDFDEQQRLDPVIGWPNTTSQLAAVDEL
jgi:hypothetical protein